MRGVEGVGQSDRAVAIVVRKSQLLVIRRERSGRTYWVLPGGSVEPGETPEEACQRELFEETGLMGTPIVEVSTYVNRGRCEHYFLVDHLSGELRLGGPEVERQSSSNRYIFEWVDRQRLEVIDLVPEAARTLCREQLEHVLHIR